MITPLEWALYYSARSWAVFPVHYLKDGRCSCGRLHDPRGKCELDPAEGTTCLCGQEHPRHKPGKHPITKNGLHGASTDPEQIRKWWKRTPRANIGCAVEWLVLDIDPRAPMDSEGRTVGLDGFDALERFEAKRGKLPESLTARTGSGGLHVHLLIPKGRTVKNGAHLRGPDGRPCGIDVRTVGGYVLLPPSNHESGEDYKWINDLPMAVAPDWLFEDVFPRTEPERPIRPPIRLHPEKETRAARYCTKALENACLQIATLGSGRNNAINAAGHTIGGYVGSGHLSESTVIEALTAAGVAAGAPERKSRDTATRAVRSGACKPLEPELRDEPKYLEGPPAGLLEEWAAAPIVDDVVGGMMDPPQIGGSGPDINVLPMLDKKRGNVMPSLSNIVEILESDPRMKGRFTYDTFSHVIRRGDEELSDSMETETNLWISSTYRIKEIPTTKVREAVICVANRHKSYPVRDWLQSLKWEGKPLLNIWLRDGLGADLPIYSKIGRMWMVSTVARAFEPGCKVDTSLILHGPQGAGKSSVFRALVPFSRWFSDSAIDIHNKDAMDALAGIWIYELAELESVRKSEMTAVKAFLSSQEDKFRPAYGRNKVSHPRQCVIVGSTNEDEFLNDPTGARRFWPVHVGKIDLEGIKGNRDQLWAEAVAAYHAGERWWLDPIDEAEMASITRQYQYTDVWDDAVIAFIVGKTEVRITDVLQVVFNIEQGKQTAKEQRRVANILRKAHWIHKQIRVHGRPEWHYVAPDSDWITKRNDR